MTDGRLIELVDEFWFGQLPERAPQAIEASDAQAVPGVGVLDELAESGAVKAPSGHDIGEHPDGAGFEQAVALVAGGHAGIAQGVAGSAAGGRIDIGRFGDAFGDHARSADHPR